MLISGSRRQFRASPVLRGAMIGLFCLLSVPTMAATPPDGDSSASSTPFRGLVELTEFQRFQLAHLPWSGDPDPARLAQLRDAWTAVTVHDDERARAMVEKDAAAGDANAQYLLAGVLLDALGPNAHYAEAEALLKKASDQGQPTAAYWLGRIRDQGMYGQPADKEEAIYWYRMADALGHPEATAQLCWLYGQGIGVPRNPQQSLIYCQRAAERGSAWAMNRLGYMYSWGIAVPRDQEKAFDWMMKAAVAGFPLAQRNIALRYLHGSGTPPDPVEAIEWLSRAADQGDADAFLEVARIYRDGLTGTVDLPKAATWFYLAADKGNAAARYEYGLALEEGRGVNKDLIGAYVYYSLAALQGYPKAEGALARLKAALNSEELDRATRMAEAARSRKPNE
jgi:TPR repeat protein